MGNILQSELGSEVQITIEGRLDREAVRRFIDLARSVHADKVVVDLRHADLMEDSVLSAMVTSLQSAASEWQGLTVHQTRLLQYLAS